MSPTKDWRFKLAWEHFKFHAEQRTRMFHFFLISIGLLLNAFVVVHGTDAADRRVSTSLLMLGGIFSTLFFTLDVRNTQLLESGEALLRKLEEENLYPASEWYERTDDGAVRLGLLSRDAVLKNHTKNTAPLRYHVLFRWVFFDNIKHKLSIRLIVLLSIFLFWGTALRMTLNDDRPKELPDNEAGSTAPRQPPGDEEGGVRPQDQAAGARPPDRPAHESAKREADPQLGEGEGTPTPQKHLPEGLVAAGFASSVAWTIYAMLRPIFDRRREQEAWQCLYGGRGRGDVDAPGVPGASGPVGGAGP